MRRRIAALLVALGLALFVATPAHAQSCLFSISSLNLGSVDVLSGSATDVAMSLGYSCSGTANTTVRICPNLGAGTGGATATLRLLTGTSNTLQYQLYQDAARTVIWGSYLWGFAARPPTIDLPLGSAGSASGSRTIYARVPTGQTTAAPGAYASTFSTSDIVFRYRSGTGQACTAAAAGWLSFTASAALTATVVSRCVVSAVNVDFGTTGVLSAAVNAVGGVTSRCTVGTTYTIGLNGGLSAAPPAARLMTKGAESITYGLYRDAARTLLWSDTAGLMITGTGSGNAVNSTVYGCVPAQTTPSPGTYSDTVVVTVTY